MNSLDVALVPVGNENNGKADNNSDAYSVIGQFNAGVTPAALPQANLGKFFATGLAARDVALGFEAQLKKQQASAFGSGAYADELPQHVEI
ncbi:hypothetical protein [uncultured Rhodoblastus sp.]|uniref:hypothetical protein n=1 Tax=uncultured Rhodoblastus sp. TaxID=543037 RepID=UPI0025DF1110|nr:hypothetical protein [uncultured Rhodoblastus sp.]